MKNFINTILIILLGAILVSSCATSQGVKLGKSGCYVTANYTVVSDKASACIYCDSVGKNSLKTLQRIFPKKNIPQNLFRGNSHSLNYRINE